MAYLKLRRSKRRSRCILCNLYLRGNSFDHRSLPFIQCARCRHIQLAVVAPAGYADGFEFHTIYPKLNPPDYENRKRRIYKPKLDWIIRALDSLKYSRSALQKMKWLEIGSGAGYFLSALKDFGVRSFWGVDGNRKLVAIANSVLKRKSTVCEAGEVSAILSRYPAADIYVAFFVLEHAENAFTIYKKLRELPRRTIFVFSVPVFGLSAILENIFQRNYARSLDGIVHQQMYTDESIRFAMKRAGFRIVSEWIFGQDASDFNRFVLCHLRRQFNSDMLMHVSNRLNQMENSFQQALDRARLADQRHILAVKT